MVSDAVPFSGYRAGVGSGKMVPGDDVWIGFADSCCCCTAERQLAELSPVAPLSHTPTTGSNLANSTTDLDTDMEG